jgi:DNA-binding transcriptional MerR regulator
MVYNDNDDSKNKNIRGKALYFSTSQVANILGIPDSRVRYYTNVFDDILHIEISNKQRRYTQADIDKMKFMIELKTEGMTIKQIQEYCQEVDFEDSKEIQIKENNPLSIQTMAKALLEQQAILINEMKQDIINSVIREVGNRLNEQSDQFNDMKTSLSKEVAITVEDVVDKQIQKSSENLENQINTNFDNMSNKLILDNQKNFEELKKDIKYISQEEIKNFSESQQQGFFSKLFKKK